MKLKTKHYVAFGLGALILLLDFLLLLSVQSRWFRPLIAVGVIVGIFPLWLDTLTEARRHRELEEKFLEFVRSLADTVKSGIPIPKAITQISTMDYGALNPYIKKLSKKIEWGIPLRTALSSFAEDTENTLIKRSMSIVIEAEQSGGNIQDVLESVTESVLQMRKIKDERRASAFSQTIQGYFVFFIFIAIMIVLQVYLLPQLADIGTYVMAGIGGGLAGIVNESVEQTSSNLNFQTIFSSLILIQGLFAGLLIGKFSEGTLKPGLKHSLILLAVGYLLFSTIAGF